MAYGEKLLYISTVEMALREADPVKRNLYLDELIDISSRNGKTRETDVLEKLKSNKDGIRDYALKNGSGYIYREMLATSYENGLRENVKVNMRIQTFDDYIISDDVVILYTGKARKVTVPASIGDTSIRKVGSGAFYGNNNIEDVNVSEGIKEIGNGTFGKCPHLKSISLESSVDVIHPKAFDGSNAIWSIKLYKNISFEAYADIVENSIKLTDGRYIIDPMILGGPFSRLIKEFLPTSMAGRFRVHKNMGCIFEAPPRVIDIKKSPKPLLFQHYADDHNATVSDFRSENAAFVFKIRADETDYTFEHDEESDDHGLSNKDIYDNSGLVFVKEFLDEETENPKAFIEIKSGTFFFQRGLRVRIGHTDYYLYFREEFSTDDNRPYVRRLGPIRIFSRSGPISEGDERNRDIYARFKFISEML